MVATVSSANKSRQGETLLVLYRLWVTGDAETGRYLLHQLDDQADVQTCGTTTASAGTG